MIMCAAQAAKGADGGSPTAAGAGGGNAVVLRAVGCRVSCEQLPFVAVHCL